MAEADSIKTHRRYCFAKYAYYRQRNNLRYLAWDAKRRTLSGTSIPADFPALAALTDAGYLALEEIDGATQSELTAAGLSITQAAAVLAAME